MTCQDGAVGRVEREGVSVVDDCCRSAIEAWKCLSTGEDTSSGGFDMQQNAVKSLMEPIVANRLAASEYPMVELPYALYESQDQFIREITNAGIGDNKRGLVVLGGIQINTGPGVPDYFLPARLELLNNRGEVVEDLQPILMYKASQ